MDAQINNHNKRWDEDLDFFLYCSKTIGERYGHTHTFISECLAPLLGRTSHSVATRLSILSQPAGHIPKKRVASKQQEIHQSEDIVEVEVYNLKEFGAFCRTKDNINGLLHISRWISSGWIDSIYDYIQVGDRVMVTMFTEHDGKVGFNAADVSPLNPKYKEEQFGLRLVK